MPQRERHTSIPLVGAGGDAGVECDCCECCHHGQLNGDTLGGSFRCEFSITNSNVVSSDEDVPIVSITDAPLADALIGVTLTAPAGFVALYDPGLGIVDFAENTSNFAAGTTTPGFSFESLTALVPACSVSFRR